MGKIETKILYPQTNYKAYLVFKFSGPRDGFDGRIFESKILFWGKGEWLSELRGEYSQDSLGRNYGWMEIELGQFLNEHEDHRTVACRLCDYDSGIRKGGIIILGIEFRPQVLVE